MTEAAAAGRSPWRGDATIANVDAEGSLSRCETMLSRMRRVLRPSHDAVMRIASKASGLVPISSATVFHSPNALGNAAVRLMWNGAWGYERVHWARLFRNRPHLDRKASITGADGQGLDANQSCYAQLRSFSESRPDEITTLFLGMCLRTFDLSQIRFSVFRYGGKLTAS